MKRKHNWWLRRIWERWCLKQQAWDFLNCHQMSDETFVRIMQGIRKDVKKWRAAE